MVLHVFLSCKQMAELIRQAILKTKHLHGVQVNVQRGSVESS